MEWISVKDLLPDDNTWVLCFLPNYKENKNQIFSLQFYMKKWVDKGLERELPFFKGVKGSLRIEYVTHWMPLPKLPKEYEEGEINERKFL